MLYVQIATVFVGALLVIFSFLSRQSRRKDYAALQEQLVRSAAMMDQVRTNLCRSANGELPQADEGLVHNSWQVGPRTRFHMLDWAQVVEPSSSAARKQIFLYQELFGLGSEESRSRIAKKQLGGLGDFYPQIKVVGGDWLEGFESRREWLSEVKPTLH